MKESVSVSGATVNSSMEGRNLRHSELSWLKFKTRLASKRSCSSPKCLGKQYLLVGIERGIFLVRLCDACSCWLSLVSPSEAGVNERLLFEECNSSSKLLEPKTYKIYNKGLVHDDTIHSNSIYTIVYLLSWL